jgi:hypothetical protein
MKEVQVAKEREEERKGKGGKEVVGAENMTTPRVALYTCSCSEEDQPFPMDNGRRRVPQIQQHEQRYLGGAPDLLGVAISVNEYRHS